MRLIVASAAILFLTVLPPARAMSSHESDSMDAASLAQLEMRADHAQVKEQCILYTELVHDYIEIASRQLAAGDMEQASHSLKRVQTFAERIHQGLARDSKRLKNAEMIVHAAAFHLGQFLRQMSSEDTPVVEATLKQLNRLHDELLAQVFAH